MVWADLSRPPAAAAPQQPPGLVASGVAYDQPGRHRMRPRSGRAGVFALVEMRILRSALSQKNLHAHAQRIRENTK